MRRAALLVSVLLTAACFGPGSSLTPGGRGIPEIAIAFPESSPPGSVQTAVLTVTNPGPQDMGAVVVAFARVGPGPESNGLPATIVDGGAKHKNPDVVAVHPAPENVSLAAIEFTFDRLREGDTTEIEFDLRVPVSVGEAANSVTVYDGADPDRVAGIRLSTIVEP
jgi:hypothetical protein